MSKWNKTEKPLTDEFLQNQQRRRQMIIQASKKRRERQKKLQQINENLKKNQQQALQKHKKQKQEAYNKYLKNNMHDKYEQIKRNQKIQQQPKKDVSKWKRKQSKQKTQTKTIEGLDLQKSHGKVYNNQPTKELPKKQKNYKVSQTKKAVEDQFKKQWAQQQQKQLSEEMIGSKLIDSLDLDVDTLQRGRQLNNKLEKIKQKKQEIPYIVTKDVDDLRKMIGYDSMLVSMDNCTQKQNQKCKQKQKQTTQVQMKKSSKQKSQVQKKQVNQQQTFNNLKHKKQAKILQWANNQVEEADDLFSNCSSKKNLSKNIQQNKGSKKVLEPIPEKAFTKNKSIEKQKKVNQNLSQQNMPPADKRSSQNVIKNSSMEKLSNASNEKRQNKQINSDKKIQKLNRQNRSVNDGENKNRSISKQKPKQEPINVFEKQRQKSLQKLRQRKYSGDRSGSVEKARKKPEQDKNQKLPKTQQQFRAVKNAPPIPSIPRPAYTVATQQQYFDVQSFIRNDLVHLNQQQRKLQEQLKNIHMENKQKVKQIVSKYDIKTDYKTSTNLIKRQQYGEQSEVQLGYAAQAQRNTNNLSEDLIEDSIQRLDDLLIKRQLVSREKTDPIYQQSHLKSQYKSIIDPLSRPQDLQKQILQLAQNISKFQNQPTQETKGYGYQRKMKKKQQSSKQYIPQQILSESKNIEDVKKPEPKKNSIKMPNPPILQYSGKNNSIIEVNLDQRYDPQDSLDTMQKGKVQVNQKLRNILFD